MISAVHLTRRFGPRVAVDNASFEIARGEIFALLGPNGAGKTTTLRMLAGLIEPTDGEVRLGGERVARGSADRLRARVGFLTESPGLWDRLTVRENLQTYARLQGLPSADAAVAKSLEVFGIADRANDQAAVLSKGLKQRVALARTLLHNPDIVLLDEPTSGLDPASAKDVRELIVNLRDENRAVLLSTHNLDEVDRVATRVAVLRQRLLASGTPASLRGQLFGTRVRVEVVSAVDRLVQLLRASGQKNVTADDRAISVAVTDAHAETPDLVRLLVNHGAAIVSVTPEEPSLEDVYLRLVQEPPPA